MKANWMLWPAVQYINFRFVPQHFQVSVSCHYGGITCEPCADFICEHSLILLVHVSQALTHTQLDLFECFV
jgi:hypothetical protein